MKHLIFGTFLVFSIFGCLDVTDPKIPIENEIVFDTVTIIINNTINIDSNKFEISDNTIASNNVTKGELSFLIDSIITIKKPEPLDTVYIYVSGDTNIIEEIVDSIKTENLDVNICIEGNSIIITGNNNTIISDTIDTLNNYTTILWNIIGTKTPERVIIDDTIKIKNQGSSLFNENYDGVRSVTPMKDSITFNFDFISYGYPSNFVVLGFDDSTEHHIRNESGTVDFISGIWSGSSTGIKGSIGDILKENHIIKFKYIENIIYLYIDNLFITTKTINYQGKLYFYIYGNSGFETSSYYYFDIYNININ